MGKKARQRHGQPTPADMAVGKEKIDELLSKPGFVLFIRHRDHIGGSSCGYCAVAKK